MNLEQIKYIHFFLVEYFKNSEDPISPAGIKNEGLLASAVARPFMSIDGKDAYIGVFNKASALFHSIINNHCFHNGNKRVALLSTLAYLGEEGWWTSIPTDEEMFEFTRKAAAHELCEDRNNELSYIYEWFKKNSRKRNIAERQLKLLELREILIEFGFELTQGKNSTIEISKNGEFITAIIEKGCNGKEDYDKQYIQRLRKKLKLTAEYGIDSYLFYGQKGIDEKLGKYMKIRHNVMRELAKI